LYVAKEVTMTTMTAGTAATMTTTAARAAGPRRWARSAGAVLGGTVPSAALALGTDRALYWAGVFPPITQVTYEAPRFIAATAVVGTLPCAWLGGTLRARQR
jgi:hypothetical protein